MNYFGREARCFVVCVMGTCEGRRALGEDRAKDKEGAVRREEEVEGEDCWWPLTVFLISSGSPPLPSPPSRPCFYLYQ